jgi:hypothetical protein
VHTPTSFIQVIEYDNFNNKNLYINPKKIELFFWEEFRNAYRIIVLNNKKYYLSENNYVKYFKTVDDVISKLKVLGIYF